MGKIVYQTGNLFSAPNLPNSYFLHSVNAQGVMGHGIALTFKEKYENAYQQYNKHCMANIKQPRSPLVGTSFLAIDPQTKFKMLCLFTSDKYGKYVDRPQMIVDATRKAINHFLETNEDVKNGVSIEIHSPKINSNLFRVPWEQSERVINECLEKYPNIKWTVWVYQP